MPHGPIIVIAVLAVRIALAAYSRQQRTRGQQSGRS